MSVVVYPGSFDPFTLGHLDILARSALLYDKVYVGVLNNSMKRHAFSPEERKTFVKTVCDFEGIRNVEVLAFDGLLMDFAHSCGAKAVIRGLRTASDFVYEVQMFAANRHLAPDIETVYLAANPALSFISSGLVREIGAFGGNIDGLVPDAIKNTIAERLLKR